VQVENYNITAVEQVKLLNEAADNFLNIGFIVCVCSWVWSNILSVKSRQLFWIVIPFLYTVAISWEMTWQSEYIFIFNKQNGMWKGGFSLSYFLGAAIIFFTLIVLLVNYLILKSFQNTKKDI
jgi:hypothetical protein